MIQLSRSNVAGTYISKRQGASLELRVDVGEDGSLDIISGDFAFESPPGTYEFHHSFQTTGLSAPEALADGERLRGAVKIHRADMLSSIARLDLDIPRTRELLATYTFNRLTEFGAQPAVVFSFPLTRVSDFFRRVELEVDQVQGIPLPHPFRTDTHPDSPVELFGRTLTFTSAYRDAGIDLNVSFGDQDVPVSLTGYDGLWSDEELHAAMEAHFSAHADMRQWRLYLLLSTQYVSQDLLGIMFDSGDSFPRQGAAVFFDQFDSAELAAGELNRKYPYTIVHELGHAFNLLHSFQKGAFEAHGVLPRPNALSWMNYPKLYPFGYAHPPGWNGSSDFWPHFHFQFDREELAHLRHNDSLEVVMGGRSFGYAGHLKEQPFAIPSASTDVSLLLWFPQTVEFMQQLEGDIRLRNETKDKLRIPSSLHPASGSLELLIRRGSDRFPKVYRHFASACACKDGREIKKRESVYQELTPSFGLRHWFVDEPGNCEIQAVVELPDGRRIASNIRRLRVLAANREADVLGADFFNVGTGTYFGLEGSRSESMDGTRETLKEIRAKLPDSPVAKQVQIIDAIRDTRVFKDVGHGKVVQENRTKAAENLFKAAGFAGRKRKPALGDSYSNVRLVRQLRAAAQGCRQEGNTEQAEKIVRRLSAFLDSVKAPAQAKKELRKFARSLKEIA